MIGLPMTIILGFSDLEINVRVELFAISFSYPSNVTRLGITPIITHKYYATKIIADDDDNNF